MSVTFKIMIQVCIENSQKNGDKYNQIIYVIPLTITVKLAYKNIISVMVLMDDNA
jgi:hypothetical protein